MVGANDQCLTTKHGKTVNLYPISVGAPIWGKNSKHSVRCERKQMRNRQVGLFLADRLIGFDYGWKRKWHGLMGRPGAKILDADFKVVSSQETRKRGIRSGLYPEVKQTCAHKRVQDRQKLWQDARPLEWDRFLRWCHFLHCMGTVANFFLCCKWEFSSHLALVNLSFSFVTENQNHPNWGQREVQEAWSDEKTKIILTELPLFQTSGVPFSQNIQVNTCRCRKTKSSSNS